MRNGIPGMLLAGSLLFGACSSDQPTTRSPEREPTTQEVLDHLRHDFNSNNVSTMRVRANMDNQAIPPNPGMFVGSFQHPNDTVLLNNGEFIPFRHVSTVHLPEGVCISLRLENSLADKPISVAANDGNATVTALSQRAIMLYESNYASDDRPPHHVAVNIGATPETS